MTYILDACALLALLNEEKGKGCETVSDLINRANRGEISLCMSLVNLVEVYYRYIQIKGIEIADVIMKSVRTLPIRFISDITDEIYFETARCKARYPFSLGDAFLCGTAKSLAAALLLPKTKILNMSKTSSLCLFSGYNNLI
jgi:PIN domain nuclease of toxin-antitoxin system